MIEDRSPQGREACPVCESPELLFSTVFESVPVLCNALASDVEAARSAPRGKFVTAYCRVCAHIFNSAFDEARIGYTQSYENSLHYSPRFERFALELVERLRESYDLRVGKTVVEIGCGKGDFLKRLCSVTGATGMGYDKSFESDRGEDVEGVTFVNDWFGANCGTIRPDLICCRHVLEHIPEPRLFLEALRSNPEVRPETVFYFEVPNALYTFRDLGIWDLIYEHVSYFTPHSLLRIFEATGFEVMASGPTFGEQYLFIEARISDRSPPTARGAPVELETMVQRFANAYHQKVRHWQTYLSAHDPRATAVWGAGSKGITFVNVVRGAEYVAALVDLNPHKRGKFAPVVGTMVVSPHDLRERTISSIIVMNPLYREEIERLIAGLGISADVVLA